MRVEVQVLDLRRVKDLLAGALDLADAVRCQIDAGQGAPVLEVALAAFETTREDYLADRGLA